MKERAGEREKANERKEILFIVQPGKLEPELD